MSNTTSIYSEAIIEAKKLREVAEANAKKTLIEAVTPRVREMIEKQLLGESIEEGDIMEDVANDLSDEKDKKNILNDDKEDEDLLLSKEAADALSKLDQKSKVLTNEEKKKVALVENYSKKIFPAEIAKISKHLKFAKELSETDACKNESGKKLFSRLVNNLVKEVKTLRTSVIGIVGKDPTGSLDFLESNITKIQEEIIQMASKKMLKEGSEMYEIDLSELDSDVGDEIDLGSAGDEEVPTDGELDGDADEEIEDVTIPGDLAQELLAALESGASKETDEMPAEDETSEMPGEESGDEDEEVTEGLDEADEEELEEGDEMVEIDEGMLKRELVRMRGQALREADKAKGARQDVPVGGKLGRAAAANVVDDFGGGKIDKEVFVDGTDDDLNVNEEIKRLKVSVQNESRKNRTLLKQVGDYKQATAKLREQLEQMNLFNAKLLYVNKLMSNESVTTRQKKTIIEALDKAKNINEVKHLYKVLSESLAKGRPAGSVNESVVRRGASASRPTQSGGASRSEADPQLDRWATLAGIPKK